MCPSVNKTEKVIVLHRSVLLTRDDMVSQMNITGEEGRKWAITTSPGMSDLKSYFKKPSGITDSQ